MAIIQIPNLPAVNGLDGTELFEGVQAGSSVKISLNQMIAATRAGLPTTLPIPISLGGTGATTAATARTNLGLGTMATQDASNVAITGGFATLTGASSVTANSASAALTVTQTGAGNAFLVEDSTSPDSTPFVVDAAGSVGVGVASPSVKLDVNGNAQLRANGAFLLQNSDNTNSYYIQNNGVTGSANPVFDVIQNGVGTRMRIDASGNLGLGVTPSAWASGWKAYEQPNGSLVSNTGATLYVTQNGHYNGTNWIYKTTNPASYYSQGVGVHQWWNAPSGTAGTALTWNERLRIDNNGAFGIGGANYGTSGQTIISAGTGAAPAWGAIGVAGGGTGITSYTIGDIVYASGTTTLSKLADVATGNALISGGVGVAPSYGKIGLTTHVSGVLPLANGGTNATTGAGAYANLLGYTATATAAGTTVLTNTSTQYQLFTGATTQTITLPVTSTLTTGWTFHIVNNSTGNLTVNSSGGNLVATAIPQTTAMVTCIGTTLTTAADWEAGFTDFGSVSGTGAVVLASGATMTGAALNGTVGATTPSTGAFTTLSASSTVSGTGFTNLFASPPAIGGTAANTGAFTTLTSTAGGINGTVGASTPSTGAFTTVTASTSVLSTGAGGIGYATGAGVAVTQLTSRTTTTPTTGAKTTGAVTLFTTTAVVGTYFSFTVPNTAIAVTDTVVLSVRGATNTYVAFVTAITAATSFQVTMASVAGIASDTPIVNFTIIKGVSA